MARRGGTSAIARRMISVAKSGAAVINFKSSMGLGPFVDRQRSMRPGRIWNAAMLRSAMALVPLTVRRSILSSIALVGTIHVWWKAWRPQGSVGRGNQVQRAEGGRR